MPAKMFNVPFNSGTYPTTPQASVEFDPTTLVFHNDSGACYISFDGVQDALHIQATHPPLAIPCRFKKVWVRQDGAAGAIDLSFLGY